MLGLYFSTMVQSQLWVYSETDSLGLPLTNSVDDSRLLALSPLISYYSRWAAHRFSPGRAPWHRFLSWLSDCALFSFWPSTFISLLPQDWDSNVHNFYWWFEIYARRSTSFVFHTCSNLHLQFHTNYSSLFVFFPIRSSQGQFLLLPDFILLLELDYLGLPYWSSFCLLHFSRSTFSNQIQAKFVIFLGYWEFQSLRQFILGFLLRLSFRPRNLVVTVLLPFLI